MKGTLSAKYSSGQSPEATLRIGRPPESTSAGSCGSGEVSRVPQARNDVGDAVGNSFRHPRRQTKVDERIVRLPGVAK